MKVTHPSVRPSVHPSIQQEKKTVRSGWLAGLQSFDDGVV